MKKLNNNNKGFSLIELIVVIVIIGILVLLATPKFLNYIEEARYTQIINDIKVLENVAIPDIIKNDMEFPIGTEKEASDLSEGIKSHVAYKKDGLVLMENDDYKPNIGNISAIPGEEIGEYYKLDRNKFVVKKSTTRLKNNFYINKEGVVIYIDAKMDLDNNEDKEHWFKVEKKIIDGKEGFSIVGIKDKFKAEYNDSISDPNFILEIPFELEENIDGEKIRLDIIDIGEQAFTYEDNLRNIDFSKAKELKNISKWAFFGSGILELDFSNNKKLELIGNAAFEKCINLKRLNLNGSNKLKKIDERAFYKCNIENLDFTTNINLEKIEDKAFRENQNLNTINFLGTNNLEKIGKESFFSCDIKKIDFSTNEKLQIIDEAAFMDNENLIEVNFLGTKNLQHINDYAFHMCDIRKLDFSESKNLISINRESFQYNYNLKSVNFNGADSFEKTGFLAFADCDIEKLDFSNNKKLENIGLDSFRNNKNLQYVKFTGAEKLEVIGSSAFTGTGLETIEFKDNIGLLTIANGAFAGCDNLNSVDLSGAVNLKTIDSKAFANNDKLKKIDLSKNINMEKIENETFNKTGIIEIHLPTVKDEYINSFIDLGNYGDTNSDLFGKIYEMDSSIYKLYKEHKGGVYKRDSSARNADWKYEE